VTVEFEFGERKQWRSGGCFRLIRFVVGDSGVNSVVRWVVLRFDKRRGG